MLTQLNAIDLELKHVSERKQMAEIKLQGNLSHDQLTTEQKIKEECTELLAELQSNKNKLIDSFR